MNDVDPAAMFWSIAHAGVWLVVVAVLVWAIRDAYCTVEQQTVGVIERFGRFHRLVEPGFHFMWPVAEEWDSVDLRLRQLNVAVMAKTSNDVFPEVNCAVQYRVIPAKVQAAYYALDDESEQIRAFVNDSVRAQVATLTLAEVFSKQGAVADHVRTRLKDAMDEYGFEIVAVLVVQVTAPANVATAMNAIQAARAEQDAATAQGEANRIRVVKQAEADAEAKRLQGEGIAAQRQAIVAGFQAAIAGMVDATHIDAAEVMNLVLLTNYFDMLAALAAHGPTTIMVPSSPGALSDLKAQLREAMLPLTAPGGVA